MGPCSILTIHTNPRVSDLLLMSHLLIRYKLVFYLLFFCLSCINVRYTKDNVIFFKYENMGSKLTLLYFCYLIAGKR